VGAPTNSWPIGWSSDGTELLFLRQDPTDSDGRYLYILHADRAETQVTPERVGGAAISPDGSRVVFADDRSDWLYAVDVGGSQPVRIGKGEEPTFSSDGTQIAYLSLPRSGCCVESGREHVWVANADGTDAHEILTDEPALAKGVDSITWSPAGDRIPIGGYHESRETIYTFAPDGSQFTMVIPNGTHPHWSPDGSQIAYELLFPGPYGLRIADADGSNIRSLGVGPQVRCIREPATRRDPGGPEHHATPRLTWRLDPRRPATQSSAVVRASSQSSRKGALRAYAYGGSRAFMRSMDQQTAAVAGPEEALGIALPFEEFFEAERERLFRALLLITHDSADAEDLMQEAFVRVWERWDRVGTLDDPVGYLFKTALNLRRSALRRTMTAATRSIRPPAQRDPIESVLERDEAMRSLASLTTRQRAAVVVTELLGYGSDEAGRILGIRPGTVRTLASQARAALRERKESEDV
jgi:RNA polymerase sigma-70 factor, ECF subfamily